MRKVIALLTLVFTLLAIPSAEAKTYVFRGTSRFYDTVTFDATPVITGGLTAANIQTGSAKREVATVRLVPETGTAVDGATYIGFIPFGRAGIVTRIVAICGVAPTVGTDIILVTKNGSAGNTMLGAANFDANTLVANAATALTLTSTAADLALAAADGVYVAYTAGAQTVDAVNVNVTVEFEPTDF